MRAFLLMVASAGKKDDVLSSLRERLQVVELHKLYGVYDVIAVVDTDGPKELSNAITGLLDDSNGVVVYIETLVERGEDYGS